MSGLLKLVCIAVLAILAAGGAHAMEANSKEADAGAGPIKMRMTKCLIANKSHEGTPCPEPQLSLNGSPAEQVASRLARAWYFIDMQNLKQARAEADAAVEINPKDAKVRHLSARISLALADMPRAEADLELARKEAPADPDIHATYAKLLQYRPADTESLREFLEIIQKYPSHLYARQEAAQLCVKFNQFPLALANFTYLIEHKPDADLFARRAEVYLALGQPQLAATDYSSALVLNPQTYVLLVARANAYALAEQNELAVRDLDSLLEITDGKPSFALGNADRAKLLAMRARSLVNLRRLKDASNDMMEALSIGGNTAILRAQVFLRRHGFPEIPINGKDASALREAITSCFSLNACFQGIIQSI